MHQLIVITGLDGTGTTTAGAALAARLSAYLLHTPAEPFREVRGCIDRGPREESPAAHYLFYLASLVHADVKLIRPKLEGQSVVCIRHLVDTVVSHRAVGLPIEMEYKSALYEIRPPDRIFMLTCDEVVRRRRIAQRDTYSHLDMALEDDSLRHRFMDEYSRVGGLTKIDTTDLTVSEVVSAMELELGIKNRP